MPYSTDTAVQTSLVSEPAVDFQTIELPVQGGKDSVNPNMFVERGPYLPLPIEGMNMGARKIGNPATHVAGFTKMPSCGGDHWYIDAAKK